MFTLTKTNNESVELRNIVEQVQKNKEDIANHYAIDRALANLGIEIVGQVTTAEDLPDPLTYQGTFGDGYAVGDKEDVDAGTATYDYYIYTRPDPNAGYVNNYWLNVGKISVVGPIGPQGPQGEKGDPGTAAMWLTGISEPTFSTEIGTMYLNTQTGFIYKFKLTAGGLVGWVNSGNIKGPQGIQGPQGPQGPQGIQGVQGPQGERGDVGGFINIAGILANEGQLPTPESLQNLTVAYLVGASEPYDLYIQVGETSETALWNNVGPLNAATLVTVNGEAQNVYEMNNKSAVTVGGQTQVTWSADSKSAVTSGGQTVQTFNADTKQNKIITITKTIATTTAFSEKADSSELIYKYTALVPMMELLPYADKNIIVKLVNNQPELFAKYGFAIRNVAIAPAVGIASLNMDSVSLPTESTITFTFEVTEV